MGGLGLQNRFVTNSALAPMILLAASLAAPALANPKDGNVVAGQATITEPDPATLLIDQASEKAIIDWRTFNIDLGETTRFQQPSAESWTLNRVTGSQDPSHIYGTLEANGNLIIVNPDGIHFGPGASVDVNRLIATTAGIGNDDFLAGNLNFSQLGKPAASIVNEGVLSVKDYGLAAFVAPSVRNSGIISARLGTISLAAGNLFTIDPYGDGLVKLAIDDEIQNDVIDVATGETVADLVRNEGTLSANGGTVAMTAATARQAVNSVVNNTGVIEATSVGMRGGKIILGGQTASSKRGGAPSQIVRVSGALNATSSVAPANVPLPRPRPENAGHVQITGEVVHVAKAEIDASGIGGGGTVLIGGDYMGGNGDPDVIAENDIPLEDHLVPTAAIVTLDEGTTIRADATGTGDGGKVIVWSDDATVTAAEITARGGEEQGDGGFIETSGKYLSVLRAADASAPNGAAGTWLLDPLDMRISGAADANRAVAFGVQIHPGIFGDSTFPTGTPSIIDVATVEAALNAGTNVHATTRGTVGGEPGDFYLDVSITKSAGGPVFAKIESARNIIFASGTAFTDSSGAFLEWHVLAPDGQILGDNLATFNGIEKLVFKASDGVTSAVSHPEEVLEKRDPADSPCTFGTRCDEIELANLASRNFAQEVSDLHSPFEVPYFVSGNGSFFNQAYSSNQGREHLGADLCVDSAVCAKPGQPVLSPVEGKVSWIFINPNDSFNSMIVIREFRYGFPTGNYVVLGHIQLADNDLGRTLSSLPYDVDLSSDPRSPLIKAGDTIGRILPASGPSTAPHLHIGVRDRPITRSLEQYSTGAAGWGRAPKGTTIEEILLKGWLDPEDYLPL